MSNLDHKLFEDIKYFLNHNCAVFTTSVKAESVAKEVYIYKYWIVNMGKPDENGEVAVYHLIEIPDKNEYNINDICFLCHEFGHHLRAIEGHWYFGGFLQILERKKNGESVSLIESFLVIKEEMWAWAYALRFLLIFVKDFGFTRWISFFKTMLNSLGSYFKTYLLYSK